MTPLRASVAVPRPIRHLFTYSIPAALEPRVRRGARVVVPFGRSKLTGYVIAVDAGPPAAGEPELKPLQEVLDPDPVLDEAVLELTRWGAEYYIASWGEMIRAALPGMKAALTRIVAITPDGERAARGGALLDTAAPPAAATPAGRLILEAVAEFASRHGGAIRLADLKQRLGKGFRDAALAALTRGGLIVQDAVATGMAPRPGTEQHALLIAPPPEGAAVRGAQQKAILAALAGAPRLRVADLLTAAGAARPALRGLVNRGLVRLEAVAIPPRPFAEQGGEPPPALLPTADQQAAIDSIAEPLAAGRFATCLLQGVTGSGKTEVYLRAIEAARARGRRALYLVPEIGLTPLLARRLRARFGEVLALLHSGLSDRERYEEWRRIREGRVEVVLGARSAVFAPIPDLGLVVVDEEHDASYKQDEHPRYNGRDLAIVRARMAGAVVVLGSATPSVESYDRARRGRYRLLRLPTRIGAAGMPSVERVDMRREFEEVGRESIASRRLIEALRQRLERREQSLVLLNRRGFSTFVQCRACGEQVTCTRCSIAMTLHLRERRLRCHYCDARRAVPERCPGCGGEHLHFGGTGTQRLEETLRGAFPSARIERMDRDTVGGRRGSVERLLTRVERGDIDILLGTQMIAKGHDFPNVTLVGVLAADALLGLPDFRAGERTFQLLSQVAGRSGRGERPGEVIVQAYDPDHHAIRAACEHDFEAFADRELEFRRALAYPPYIALAILLLRDRDAGKAGRAAAEVAAALRALKRPHLQVLGPAPAPLERLRGKYRMQIVLKATNRREMQEALRALLAELDRRETRQDDLTIDVDPVSTM